MKLKECAKVFSGVVSVFALSMFISNVDANAAVLTGQCGKSANYSYDEDTKTLNITGSGEIETCVFAASRNYGDPETTFSNDQTKEIGKNVETVVIGNGITKIGYRSFYFEENLKKVTIPESVTRIEDEAFSLCKKNESFNLPSKLEYIGKLAFGRNIGTKDLKIPKSLKSVGSDSYDGAPFSYCEFENVVFEEGTENVLEGILKFTTIKNLVFAQSTKIIEREAFKNCNIEDVVLPYNLEEIGFQAFYGCYNMKNLTIYQKVKNIADYAFTDLGQAGYLKNTTIHCKGGSYAWDYFKNRSKDIKVVKAKVPALKGILYKKGGLKYMVVYEAINGSGTVKVIGMTKNKKSIVIPKTVKLENYVYKVTAIEKNAFNGKKKLKKITIKSKDITSIGKNAFKKINAKAKFFVPKAKFKAYKKMLNKKAGVTKKMKIKKK